MTRVTIYSCCMASIDTSAAPARKAALSTAELARIRANIDTAEWIDALDAYVASQDLARHPAVDAA